MAKWLRRLLLDQKFRSSNPTPAAAFCAAVIAVAQTVTYKLLKDHEHATANMYREVKGHE